ncbi:MAG TPA: NAD(P)/FAD-dependent oxidoreductase [Polyangiaceae bacterium]|jgi:glycine/D-amino acid oxidase-like deaminating enzyme|nr:NAD(P)/FAD-dependent oxidoreductase [Polyangiaceae bacterium]
MTSSPPSSALVLGAGPSGLAVAACLKREGVSFTQIDRASIVGSRWHEHYDRLHLHTMRELSSLPGYAMPSDWPRYVPRAKFAEYLGRYAAHHGLAPRLGVTAHRATRAGGRWSVETSEGTLEAAHLVVATGYNHTAKMPDLAGRETFTGEVLHSRAYKNGKPHRGKRVLVVGAGNSGAEIALDLWEHGAHAAISIRGPIHVTPRDMLGVPTQATAQIMAKLPPRLADVITLRILSKVVGDLSKWGIRRPEIGPISQVVKLGRIPLIDVGTIDLVKQGKIVVYPDIESLDATGVRFVDGRRSDFDAIVLATGYSAALDRLFGDASAFTDERGYPREHAKETGPGGLWFVGYRNPLTGALHDIAREGDRVARGIAAAG